MSSPAKAVRIRPMNAKDLERVLEIAESLREAPHWAASAYLAAMDARNSPRRVALVAEFDSGRVLESCESAEKQTAGAKAHARLAGSDAGTQVPAYQGLAYQSPAYRPSRFGVVGFAVVAVVAGEAELETIAVAAEVQRRGVGRLLSRALVDELKTAQVSELHLEVRASNQMALGFYRNQGFEEAGRRPRYYADPEEDAVLMTVSLV
jgi:ribosomal-protein-alanine acetyltransferase